MEAKTHIFCVGDYLVARDVDNPFHEIVSLAREYDHANIDYLGFFPAQYKGLHILLFAYADGPSDFLDIPLEHFELLAKLYRFVPYV